MRIFFLIPLMCLTGCGQLSTPPDDYVAGDRATFDAIAPIVRNLADADPSNDPDLSGVNGRAVLQAVESWELRLTIAEKGMGRD